MTSLAHMTNAVLAELSVAEVATLEAHERTIERGFQTFVDVGTALMAIRDGKLYREKHGTFEEYCDKRWGMARSTAYQYIDASIAVGNVRHGGQTLPSNERQARPLTRLDPEQQREVWSRVVETAPGGDAKNITAAHVKSVVEQFERKPAANIVHVSDDSYEWFTPPEYIEAARKVMGGIDLDPASCSEANEVVKARKFYTREDDGLAQKWRGRVWLNPPYNMPLIEQFSERVVSDYSSGVISSAIVLTNNSTDTKWFHTLMQYPVCFPRRRLTFWNGLDRLAARQGQALFYLGPDLDNFSEVFNAFGVVLVRA